MHYGQIGNMHRAEHFLPRNKCCYLKLNMACHGNCLNPIKIQLLLRKWAIVYKNCIVSTHGTILFHDSEVKAVSPKKLVLSWKLASEKYVWTKCLLLWYCCVLFFLFFFFSYVRPSQLRIMNGLNVCSYIISVVITFPMHSM